jgi:hypothetical protein
MLAVQYGKKKLGIYKLSLYKLARKTGVPAIQVQAIEAYISAIRTSHQPVNVQSIEREAV